MVCCYDTKSVEMQNILLHSEAVKPGKTMEEAHGTSSNGKKAGSSGTEPAETASCLEALVFPYSPPQTGTELVDITPEIKWLRMPVPFALDHVNVYLIRDLNGWVIVDTGMDTIESRSAWEEIFAGPLRGENITGIFCTHFHIDHMGLAGYLAERCRAPLFATYEEYFSLRGWPTNLEEVPWQHADFFKQAGLPAELLPQVLTMFRFSPYISPPPPSFIRLQEGRRLPVCDADWQVIIGQGHSPEPALFFSAEQKILVSGDQLLPRISTNVSISAVNSEDEPLSSWFASLDRLSELPDDVLVLPGHGLPFHGAKRRVAELRTHHERRLATILDACTGQHLSVYELVRIIYQGELSDFDLQLALGECLSHVRFLLVSNRMIGAPDGHGVVRYRILNQHTA